MLYGRATESALLDRLLDDAREARGRALVLRGEAGIGKSALLDAMVGGAEGFRLLRGKGVESERDLPFAAVHRIVRPVLDHADLLDHESAVVLALEHHLASHGGGTAGPHDQGRAITQHGVITTLRIDIGN